jgi:hypothetical protein
MTAKQQRSILLTLVGAGVFVCVLLVRGAQGTASQLAAAKIVESRFVSAFSQRKYNEAYQLTTSAYRKVTPFDAFRGYVDDCFQRVGGHINGVTENGGRIDVTTSGNFARAFYRVAGDSKEANMTLYLEQRQGTWMIRASQFDVIIRGSESSAHDSSGATTPSR